jgi:DNA-binding FrmR family transcriptional regulator
MCTAQLHQSHPEILKRLSRASGHLKSVIEMIESGRPCLDIAQQLHAVEKALATAKQTLIHDHIDHCLHSAAQGPSRNARSAISEFKELTKYL